MDLNQLYFDHQVLLMRAARAPASADAVRDLRSAAQIAGRIGDLQRAKGAAAEGDWNRRAANEQARAAPAPLCGAGA